MKMTKKRKKLKISPDNSTYNIFFDSLNWLFLNYDICNYYLYIYF